MNRDTRYYRPTQMRVYDCASIGGSVTYEALRINHVVLPMRPRHN